MRRRRGQHSPGSSERAEGQEPDPAPGLPPQSPDPAQPGSWPEPSSPQQPSYPQQPYPQQPSYPAPPQFPSEPYYSQQPSYPQQPSYSQQPSYPQQPPYPAQPTDPMRSAYQPAATGPPSLRPPAAGGAPGGRGRRKRWIALITATVLVLGLAGAAGAYEFLRTRGSPQQTAATFLAAWQRGNYPAMAKVSLHVPASGLAAPFGQVGRDLGVRSTHLALGKVTASGSTARAEFTATDALASGHVWTYHGLLTLVSSKRRWWVTWSPAAIYPGLRAGERFSLSSAWPTRAPILSADGTALSSPAAQAQSGSLALVTGYVVHATRAEARKLGAPYRAGDEIGVGGIEQAYQAVLAGRPSVTIHLVGPGNHVDAVAARFPATPGKPVRTSIQMTVQLAAAHAVASASTRKPIDMVVIQPSNGEVLAVVERPGGFDRALQGIFPPGSTFKVVTASALAKVGMTPSSPVQCPSKVTIDGRLIHNAGYEHAGATNLLTAFAISCNTTFAMLATQRLTGNSLRAMARTYGYNRMPSLGIPATLGHFSTPHSPIDLAADAFGQGTDLVNPLSQAAEVAAVESGTWRSPRLVISPAPRVAKSHVISPAILAVLRPMMRAVVTSGTAAGVGLPPGTFGKTGTAEYGTGPHLKAHSWFIGYRGDLAFAVLVEGGGFGAKTAAPIADAFLRGR